MIRASSVELNEGDKTAKVFLEADTKSEIQSMQLSDIVGFPQGYKIDFFSKAMTTSGELGILKSDGTWNWGD